MQALRLLVAVTIACIATVAHADQGLQRDLEAPARRAMNRSCAAVGWPIIAGCSGSYRVSVREKLAVRLVVLYE